MTLKNKLVNIVRKECRDNAVKLYLGNGKSVNYSKGIQVNGFFDSNEDEPYQGKLSCAIGRQNWELILVHEFNHMMQWKENCKVWQNYEIICDNVIDEVISGKDVDLKNLEIDARTILLLEHDCEKRSYNTLKNLGHPKEKLVEYVQKANAYALFYLYIIKKKKWYEIGKEPYNLKSVWSKFPKTFNIDIDATYARLGHLYDKCVKVN